MIRVEYFLGLAFFGIASCAPPPVPLAPNEEAVRIIPAPPVGLDRLCSQEAHGQSRIYVKCMTDNGYQAEIVNALGQREIVGPSSSGPGQMPIAAPGRHPLVMTQDQLNAAMAGAGHTWNCDDGSRITVNTAPPVALIYSSSQCTFTFVDGRTASVTEGSSCNLGVALIPSTILAAAIKMHQSVSIRGSSVMFSAQQVSGGLGPLLNKGSGTVGGTFNTTSGRFRINGGTVGSASTLMCRKP